MLMLCQGEPRHIRLRFCRASRHGSPSGRSAWGLRRLSFTCPVTEDRVIGSLSLTLKMSVGIFGAAVREMS